MNTKKRTAALTLALVLIFSVLCGCATKPYVMVIDGMNIRQGIYAYYYGFSYANYYSNYGDTTVNYYAMTNICQHVAVYRLFDQLGLTFDDADNKTVEDMRTSKLNELGGQGGYAAFLKTVGLTDKLYREILAVKPKYEKLKDYLYSEGGPEYIPLEDVRQIYAGLYAHEVHILISTTDVETTAEQDELYARAEEAHARALAGEDFTELILEYGDDAYMAEYPDAGLYLAEGDSGSEIIDEALFSLEIGGISDILTTPSGFVIYKRLPVEESYLDQVFESGSMYDQYIETTMSYYLMEVMTSYDIEYLTAFYEVDFTKAAAAFA